MEEKGYSDKVATRGQGEEVYMFFFNRAERLDTPDVAHVAVKTQGADCMV